MVVCLKISSWPIDLIPHSCLLLIEQSENKRESVGGRAGERNKDLEGGGNGGGGGVM